MATSANRNYPKMTAGNYLKDDVPDLNAAIDMIDSDVQSLVGATAEIVPSESPAFSGTPTTPTASPGASDQQIANTQFVAQALASLMGAAPGQLDTLNELAAALGNDPDFAASMTAALADKATLAQLADKFDKSGGPVTGAIIAPSITTNGQASIGGRLIVNDQDNADGSFPIQFQNSDQAAWFLRALDTNNNFAIHLNGAGDLLSLSAEGYLTKPNQPAFAARGYASRDVNGNHTFSVTDFNEGNHYNPVTGIFTAPETGVYAVHAFVGYKETTNYLGLWILVNGSTYQQAWTDNTINNNNAALGGPIKLIEGDTLNVGSHPSYTFPQSQTFYSGFSAYLMG